MAKKSNNNMYHQIMDSAEIWATKRDNTVDICALVNILRSSPNGGGAIVQAAPQSQLRVQSEEDECKYPVKAIRNLCKFSTNDDDNGDDSGSSKVEESAASDKGDDRRGNYGVNKECFHLHLVTIVQVQGLSRTRSRATMNPKSRLSM